MVYNSQQVYNMDNPKKYNKPEYSEHRYSRIPYLIALTGLLLFITMGIYNQEKLSNPDIITQIPDYLNSQNIDSLSHRVLNEE